MKSIIQFIAKHKLAFIIQALAWIIILVVLQLNWAHDNKYYNDLNIRIGAALALGLFTAPFYSFFSQKFFRFFMGEFPEMEQKFAYSHLGFFVLLAYVIPDEQSFAGFHKLLLSLAFFITLAGIIYWAIIKRETEWKQHLENNARPIFIAIGFIGILGVRLVFLPQLSQDTVNWVLPWMDFIKKNGFSAYAFDFNNYAPAYSYLLGLGILTGLPDIQVIKFISLAADLVAVYFAYKILSSVFTPNAFRTHWGSLAMFALPSMLINSAFWGQCDMLWVSFCLGSLSFILQRDNAKNNFYAVLCFAIAISFKFQAILFAPVLVIFWLKREVKLIWFLSIPAVYLIWCIPSLIAGRSFSELLLIYFAIVEENAVLTANSPNIYQFVGQEWAIFGTAGIVFTLAVLAAFYAWFFHSLAGRKPWPLLWIRVFAFISLLTPYLMPRIHERYMLMAEVGILLIGLFDLRRFWMVFVMALINFLSYTDFLFGKQWISFQVLSMATLFLLLFMLRDLYLELSTNNIPQGKKIEK